MESEKSVPTSKVLNLDSQCIVQGVANNVLTEAEAKKHMMDLSVMNVDTKDKSIYDEKTGYWVETHHDPITATTITKTRDCDGKVVTQRISTDVHEFDKYIQYTDWTSTAFSYTATGTRRFGDYNETIKAITKPVIDRTEYDKWQCHHILGTKKIYCDECKVIWND